MAKGILKTLTNFTSMITIFHLNDLLTLIPQLIFTGLFKNPRLI